MTGSEQFQYTARSLTGTYDTRHEAVGDLARYGDWENDTVVPITENCLVRQQGSITVGPVHLGNKYWNDREIYPMTRGVAQIKQVSLVKEVNGNRDSVEESWWATDCPVCHSRLEVQGASEDKRRELLEELLDCCDIEWFPPSDWIEDCEVCGCDHRESSGCTSLTYREPFPSPEEHRYDCSECEWSGEGDDFDNSLGNCPDCGTSAVQALPVATDGGPEQTSVGRLKDLLAEYRKQTVSTIFTPHDGEDTEDTDTEVRTDARRDDHELDHYDLLLRSMEEGLLVGVNRDDRHHTGTDELRVEYSRDDRTEVQLKRGFEDYVEIHRDRHGDLVLSELDDEIGLRKEMDVVTIEIMGIGSDPADVSVEDHAHQFEQGDRFAGLPDYQWEVTNRMIDVDTDDTLYHLLGVGDPNRNDTKVITDSSLRENFDRVAEAGDGDE